MSVPPELSPRQRAEVFVTTVNMIGKPPQTPRDELLQSMLGPGVEIRSVVPGQPGVAHDFAERIRDKVASLVDPADVTPSYKAAVKEKVDDQLDSPIMRLMGSAMIVHMAGIDLQEERLGMFDDDPEKRKEAEKRALRMQREISLAITAPSLAREEARKLTLWWEDYRNTYGNEDPLA